MLRPSSEPFSLYPANLKRLWNKGITLRRQYFRQRSSPGASERPGGLASQSPRLLPREPAECFPDGKPPAAWTDGFHFVYSGSSRFPQTEIVLQIIFHFVILHPPDLQIPVYGQHKTNFRRFCSFRVGRICRGKLSSALTEMYLREFALNQSGARGRVRWAPALHSRGAL